MKRSENELCLFWDRKRNQVRLYLRGYISIIAVAAAAVIAFALWKHL